VVFECYNNRIEKLLPFLILLVTKPFSSINKNIPATTTTTTAKELMKGETSIEGESPRHAFVVISA
jgi:hypothetical protein